MSSLSDAQRQQRRIRREQRRGLAPTITQRNAMVLQHYGLAHLAAQRQSARGTGALDDLLQEASLGLIKAVSGFDPSRGHRFSSYGVAMAQGQILHYRRDREAMLHVPWRLASLHAKGMRLQQQRQHQQLPLLSPDRLAQALGVTRQRWQEACTANDQQRLISLHQPVHRDSSSDASDGCLLDQLRDGRDDGGDDGARDWLLQALQQLPDQTRQWLIRHHIHGESLRQISVSAGINSRVIRAELRQALDNLQQLACRQPSPSVQSTS